MQTRAWVQLEEIAKAHTDGIAEVSETLAAGLAEVARERVAGLAEVSETLAAGLAEVAKERAEVAKERAEVMWLRAEVDNGRIEVAKARTKLEDEILAMQQHEEAQEGRVELNIGGYKFVTSVQTLRRLPQNFFSAFFSGRYAQDVCADGIIFVDRDGKHFHHVLEYLRDGTLLVAEQTARPTVSLLRALEREFGFYCIEPPHQSGFALVLGGIRDDDMVPTIEMFDLWTNQFSWAGNVSISGYGHAVCMVGETVYLLGGAQHQDCCGETFAAKTVDKYSPVDDTWSAGVPLPMARLEYIAVTVGSAIECLQARRVFTSSTAPTKMPVGPELRPCHRNVRVPRSKPWEQASTCLVAPTSDGEPRKSSSNMTRCVTSGAPWTSLLGCLLLVNMHFYSMA
jgi:hypothetical protein